MIKKKIIGLRRYLDKPFGKTKKYKVYEFDNKTFEPIEDILITTGRCVYPSEFYDLYDLVHDEPYSIAAKEKQTKKKFYSEKKRIIPDNVQQVYLITEETYINGKEKSVFVEARFMKNVTFKEWLKTPLYKRHQVNWIH